MKNLLEWSGILLLCIVCLGFISTLIIIVTGKINGRDRFAKTLKGLVIGSIIYAFLNSFLTARIYLYSFYSDLGAKPSATLIYSGKKITVTSSSEIDSFIKILKESERISAHHSHPINEIELIIPEDEATYNLGKDSYNIDEYWLNIKNGGIETTLLHFKSTVLLEWLRRNGIRY